MDIDLEVLILLIIMAACYLLSLSLALMAIGSLLRRRFLNTFALTLLSLVLLSSGYGLTVRAERNTEEKPVLGGTPTPTENIVH